MTHSTSPKLYILLAFIATLAIAAVASQVVASPQYQGDTIFLIFGDATGWDGHVSDVVQTSGPYWVDVSFTWQSDHSYESMADVAIPYTVVSDGGLTGAVVSKMTWEAPGCGSAWWEDPWNLRHCTSLVLQPPGTDVTQQWEATGIVTATQPYASLGSSSSLAIISGQQMRGQQSPFGPTHIHFRWELVSIGGVAITDPGIATPIPQGALPCITGTTSITPTVRATMTPFVRGTPPAPYTVTVRPVSSTVGYDSGVMSFDNDVSQLSAVGAMNSGEYPHKFLRWSSEPGNDGRPGVAMLHAGIGNVYTVTAQEMLSNSVVAVFKTGGYTGPVAVSFYARTAYTLTSGANHSMRVWYLDPDYSGPGQGMWVASHTGQLDVPPDPQFPLSNVWRKFGAAVTAVGGSGKIAAIAVSDERYALGSPDTPPCPVSGGGMSYGCVYLDDLRIAYGDAAGLVLPYCDGTDPNGVNGRNPLAVKTCVIPITTIDLSATCIAPTGIDLGQWLSYLWCRIWRFFGFFQENRDQVDAIIARQSINEPFGSIFETGAIYDDLGNSVETLRASNKPQSQNPIEWVGMFLDGSALDQPAQFAVPDIASAQTYMASCPNEAMFSNSTANGACMALYMMRQTIIITLFQWGLNALFVVSILFMIRGDLEKLAS